MKKISKQPTPSEVTEQLKREPRVYFNPDFGQIEAVDTDELKKKVNKLREEKKNGNS
ncbi:MAG: hypothetical protein WA972_05655 [Rhodococcus qingshengii]